MSDSDSDLFKADEIPNYVIVSLAKLLLPEIETFYYSEEGKAYFANWEMEHKKQ